MSNARSKSGMKKALSSAFLLAAVGACAVVIAGCGGDSSPEVPAVIDESEEDARAAVEDAGLRVNVQTDASSAPAGTVTAQSHQADDRVPSDTVVKLTVSGGPDFLSPAELTQAYGELEGICIAAKALNFPLDFENIDSLRTHLQGIVATAEGDPDAESTDEGVTSREILFESAAALKGCDEALRLEAQAAIDALAAEGPGS